MLKNESFPAKITIVIFTSFVVAAGILVYLKSSLGVVKACTVESAELISDSSGLEGLLPTTSVDIQTKECGKLTVVNLKTPSGMNKAGLAEFLKEHQGENLNLMFNGFLSVMMFAVHLVSLLLPLLNDPLLRKLGGGHWCNYCGGCRFGKGV